MVQSNLQYDFDIKMPLLGQNPMPNLLQDVPQTCRQKRHNRYNYPV